MCGIAGIVSSTGQAKPDILRHMTDLIAHRGPDGDGHWVNQHRTVGLGHRRLAIIDLSDDGKQPMHYAGGRYTLTFNGEIYNYIELKEFLVKKGYKFKSSSDTEVLLALYDLEKEKCLSRLDGMFAFAIWDELEQKLFCARDRFGEKPFFYARHNGSFLFASEMKALWVAGVGREINYQLVFNFIARSSTFNPNNANETFFEGIYKLPAAHYFTISPQHLEPGPIRYWDIDYSEVNSDITEESAAEKFRKLFIESVSRRLRSDVPVGSSLSGGLDSSLVVCVIDELNRDSRIQQNTFSARFPGYAKDEGKYMEMVIDQTNVKPHFVYPDEKGLVNDLEDLVYHQEEPFGSASIYAQYCVMRSAKENNITVLLDGQGADEILAGYHFYFADYFRELRSRERQGLQAEREAYRRIHGNGAANGNGGLAIAKTLGSAIPRQLETRLRTLAFRLQNNLQPLFHKDFYAAYSGGRADSAVSRPESLSESLYRSTRNGGLEELLRYADRNSMAHSREVRLPFLNHELVEFVFSLPSNFKIRDGVTKFIMRSAFADILPKGITDRTDKIGYEPPQADWLKRDSMRTRVLDARNFLQNKKVLSPSVNLSTSSPPSDSSLAWKVLQVGMLMDQ